MEDLDRIDWDDLKGSWAGEVPALLRTIAAGGAPAAAEAIDDLRETIWHQGSVSEVSAAAVPFLGELCADGSLDPDDRAQLADLLFLVGRGRSYWRRETAARSRGGPGLDTEFAAHSHMVETCGQAVEQVAGQLLAGLTNAPQRLRLPIAALALVAGQAGHDVIPALRDLIPSLSPFGAAAADLVIDLLTARSVPIERFAAVEAHNYLLEDFGNAEREDGTGVIDIDDYFVDLLGEEMTK